MTSYLLRRLLLLPITLLGIVFINFVIINLAPGDPVTVTPVSETGEATRRDDRQVAFGSDERYLQMREHFGLTLPILFNTWPWTHQDHVISALQQLTHREEMSIKKYDALRLNIGDRARFIMPELLQVIQDASRELAVRQMASRFFARGGTRQAYLGANISPEERRYNRKISIDNTLLRSLVLIAEDSPQEVQRKVEAMSQWYAANKSVYWFFDPSPSQKVWALFFETRFVRYMSRVFTLDFGTLRNDDNKTVISEVAKRFKYSLTLALIPMLITFVLCQVFGFLMAYQHNRWPDVSFNVFFLILYAIPIFVVAPFLIEKVALNGYFPLSGFTSPDNVYDRMTSWQRFGDVARHIFLPIVAIMYGGLAAQARLSRTAVLEVLRQDYVRTARAKGLAPLNILWSHVGRNAAITIVTSLAGSLGVVLGGSLIVETLFEINGFGKFFYDAVVNWDYNVIMFSAFAGSLITLIGYLVADIAYTALDPRVTLE